MNRIYQWSFAELIDRMSIVNLKILYSLSEEMKLSFVKERDDIISDINSFINEGIIVDGLMSAYISNLQIINYAIWVNEDEIRKGECTVDEDWEAKYKKLLQSHKWNCDRANCKKAIQDKIGGRVDHKLNYSRGSLDLRL